jgi:hypothetical protein
MVLMIYYDTNHIYCNINIKHFFNKIGNIFNIFQLFPLAELTNDTTFLVHQAYFESSTSY